jgi:GT2 family glycosyltransferase
VDVVVGVDAGLGAGREALAELLDRRFPGRHTLVEVQDGRSDALVNAAANVARGRRLLLADPASLMHDPRTLETLYVLALDDKVASAGCLTIREEAFKKGSEVRFQTGGIFPSHISLLGAPHLVFTEPYTLSVFPGATYPVVANCFLLALVNPAVWKSLGGLDLGPHAHVRSDLDFCARALLAGYNHLCTAAVSVSCLRDGAEAQFMDSLALHRLAPHRWHELLSRVTILHNVGA